MGVAVSNWRLAKAVSEQGQLGVVSGTSLAMVQARLLQRGDPGGHLRRTFDQFPWPDVAERVWERYYVEGRISPATPFRAGPMPSMKPSKWFLELTVLGNFAEGFWAKENHDRQVGINFLEKLQLPTLPSIYGAMLAGVDTVLMGAGIPRSIPGVLDELARNEAVEMLIDIEGMAPGNPAAAMRFDPRESSPGPRPEVRRPKFFAIISSATLAITLARRSNGVSGRVCGRSGAGGRPQRATTRSVATHADRRADLWAA